MRMEKRLEATRVIAWSMRKDPVGFVFLDFLFGAYGRTVTYSFFNFKSPVEEESFEDPINTDRAVQLESRKAAAGEVVHDTNEDWIFGYNRGLGKCSIFNAEL
ncbi:hypothetical protein PVK06_025583 [Gossypium arboreum]|uniref:Uncharacterized protein n=1 Tax=Gossypium arboreum TaxID=29729 RepID=A0ABR0PGY4_GOSAR|nr:hypothetical protein PVK06_025583 [Gossypium arboreum]